MTCEKHASQKFINVEFCVEGVSRVCRGVEARALRNSEPQRAAPRGAAPARATHQNFFLYHKKKRSMTSREIKNLQSSLLNTNPQGRRRIRTDEERSVNFSQYLLNRENRNRKAKNTRSQRAYQRGETTQANYKLKGYKHFTLKTELCLLACQKKERIQTCMRFWADVPLRMHQTF